MVEHYFFWKSSLEDILIDFREKDIDQLPPACTSPGIEPQPFGAGDDAPANGATQPGREY